MSEQVAEEKKKLSYSGWIRQQMLATHNLTLEQLQEAQDKSDWGKLNYSTGKHEIYRQKSVLCKRWGISSVDEIPRKTNGQPNLSGLVRLFLKKNPNGSCADCIKHFAIDGLELSVDLFHNARIMMRKKESPDDNQHTGPRAGKPEKMKRERKPKDIALSDNVYIQMLLDAKKLVQKMGGIDPTRKMLDILEMIQA